MRQEVAVLLNHQFVVFCYGGPKQLMQLVQLLSVTEVSVWKEEKKKKGRKDEGKEGESDTNFPNKIVVSTFGKIRKRYKGG